MLMAGYHFLNWKNKAMVYHCVGIEWNPKLFNFIAYHVPFMDWYWFNCWKIYQVALSCSVEWLEWIISGEIYSQFILTPVYYHSLFLMITNLIKILENKFIKTLFLSSRKYFLHSLSIILWCFILYFTNRKYSDICVIIHVFFFFSSEDFTLKKLISFKFISVPNFRYILSLYLKMNYLDRELFIIRWNLPQMRNWKYECNFYIVLTCSCTK